MDKKINIALADDHHLFREGLVFLLRQCPFIGEITEAGNGAEIIHQLSRTKPDVVLMDIEMPLLNGIEASKKCLMINPELKIIALSMYAGESFYSEMIDAGARGFLLKNSSFDEVKNAIHAVYEGKNYFSPEILNSIVSNINQKVESGKGRLLSGRETEILFFICKGLSNLEIADKLFISKRTVDKHRENIMLKTGCRNTAALVVYAVKNQYFVI